jgi:hypothetical protein
MAGIPEGVYGGLQLILRWVEEFQAHRPLHAMGKAKGNIAGTGGGGRKCSVMWAWL